jgi:hypothetical protein
MPLTGYSTIAPLEQVWAFGWFVNRLLSTRPSRRVLVGTWVLALPALLSLAAIALSIVTISYALSPGTGLCYITPALIFDALYLVLVARVTRSYFRSRPTPSATSPTQGQAI